MLDMSGKEVSEREMTEKETTNDTVDKSYKQKKILISRKGQKNEGKNKGKCKLSH